MPVSPQAWRAAGERRWSRIDQALGWIGEQGMYAILDFHSIGFLLDGYYPESWYVTSEEGITEFWRTASSRYASNEVVAFYELFNEPVTADKRGAEADWLRWAAFCEGLVDVIRKNDEHTPIIVGGLDYAYDLSHVLAHPLDRPSIVYATHVYPQRQREGWDRYFGDIAERFPVFCTELGFDSRYPQYAEETLFGQRGRYRRELIEYLEERGISWTVWSFAVQWGPGLLEGWDYTPNEAGAFYRQQLLSHQGR